MTNEQLCEQIQAGDMTAFRELLDNNLRYVEQIAFIMKNKFSGLSLDVDDLVQEGLIGMTMAVKEYDSSTGFKFLTFADRLIDNAMYDYIRKVRSYSENEIPASEACDGDEEDGRFSIEDLAIDPELFLSPYSLDLYDCYHYSPEQIYLRKELYERLHNALDSIPERESVYLKHRYGFVDRFRSRKETSQLFSLSESRAEKLEKKALGDVKGHFLQAK